MVATGVSPDVEGRRQQSLKRLTEQLVAQRRIKMGQAIGPRKDRANVDSYPIISRWWKEHEFLRKQRKRRYNQIFTPGAG